MTIASETKSEACTGNGGSTTVDEIQLLAETVTLLAEHTTASLAAHRIVVSALLCETLTREQHRRVMAVSDLLVDTWKPPPGMDVDRLRYMVLQSVASFKTSEPPQTPPGADQAGVK